MHDAVIDFLRTVVQREGLDQAQVSVLDIGGAKVSTSRYYQGPQPYELFENASLYHVLDIREAPGVDIIMDATKPGNLLYRYDVVVCTEVLEHVKEWPRVLETAHYALKPGGLLILTCAAPGRPEHSGVSETLPVAHDEWYGNIPHLNVRTVLLEIGFRDVLTNQVGQDTQAVARK